MLLQLSHGFEVDVIDMAPHALGRLIPETAAVALQNKLSALGACWHFNTTVQSINRVNDQLHITLANGSVLNIDVALSAVGLKPRLELAKAAGIDTNLGIQVNRKLQTNIPHIYAIGDCAEVDGLVPSICNANHASSASISRDLDGASYTANVSCNASDDENPGICHYCFSTSERRKWSMENQCDG